MFRYCGSFFKMGIFLFIERQIYEYGFIKNKIIYFEF